MKRLETHAIVLYLVCGVMQCRQVSCADSSMGHSFSLMSVCLLTPVYFT